MIRKGKVLVASIGLGLSFSSFGLDLSNVEPATNLNLDLHSMLDMDLDSSAFLESTKILMEKPEDKNLAPLVIIVNRAPKGTADDAQRAKVYIEGVLVDTVKVSTGKIGHESRTGYFRPVYTNHLRVYDTYYSSKYDSLMNKAIFYSGGYAIHHTDAVSRLGSRASHGCVRFHNDDITKINDLAMSLGSADYQLRKWKHAVHKNTKKYIVHYKGLEKSVTPINRYSGVIDEGRKVKSLDMVIIVKDERDTDK